jgi:hypothetical protein
MNKDNIASRGICTLCSKCNMNTRPHYLHNKLIIYFCDCKKLGGLHIGFSKKPLWKLYACMNKMDFLTFAQSAQAYVEVIKEAHRYSKFA